MADIDADSSRLVKQCSNARDGTRLTRIVRSNVQHRVIVASPHIQSRARDQDRITNVFTSSKRLMAVDVRGASSSSLRARSNLMPPKIALPTHLSLSHSPDDTLRLIIGDYTIIDSTVDSPSNAYED
eukprot:Gb_11329 [translate_table: standard]